MNETYSSQYLDTLINRYTDNSDLIEYEDSLYLTDSGGVYRDRVPVEVTVTGNSDSTVNFSVKYDLMFIDEDFFVTTDYRAIFEDGRWLLDDVQNNVEALQQ